jgi:hypothetical protein
MNNIPKEHLYKEAQESELNMGDLPVIRAVFLIRAVFHLNIEIKENPTKR